MEKYNLEDVFVTEGVPEHTFVQPPNFTDIFLDIRKKGKPVIIEGQSGTGKTTTVNFIIKILKVDVSVESLTARKPADVERIEQIALNRPEGYFVIDDFHRLSNTLQEHLADIAKLSAEQGIEGNLPKLIIIGINQVGSDLIQLVGDIAKRVGIHQILPGGEKEIQDLIESGCQKLGIDIIGRERIWTESRGDYWLTQQMCQAICSINGITETEKQAKTIDFGLSDLRERMIRRLDAAYYPTVKAFCRGRRFRPSNDPYFKLLRTVGQQESSVVDLNELANAISDVRGSINNVKERRLAVLIDSKTIIKDHFYYNVETKNFAIEDPALFYFIRHLNWTKLRKDCGFRDRDQSREWDVAISFAGENRQLAEHIAEQLEFLDVHVFFDKYYEDNYLGKAWSEQFRRIFSDESDIVVCILDRQHHEKIWPTFERDCFSSRQKDGDIIPVFLDDTVFVGIPRDTVGIQYKWDASDPDWKSKATNEIVIRLIDRLSI